MADEVASSAEIPHRIGRILFDLDGGDEDRLLALRAEIAGGAESWLPEMLSEAFDMWAGNDRTISLDRLDIFLGDLGSAGRFDRARLRHALDRALADLSRPGEVRLDWPGPRKDTAEREVTAAIRHFLKTGTLPWWSPAAHLAELFAMFSGQPRELLAREIVKLAPALRQSAPAERLVLQAPQGLIEVILAVLRAHGSSQAPFTPRSRPGEAAPAPVNAVMSRRALTAALRQAAEMALGRGPAEPSKEHRDAQEDADTEAVTENPPDEGIDATLDVAFAGVVLLHPFLPTFFETLGLWRSDTFTSAAAHETAVHLTAYLASAQDRHEEPDLVLAKVLCGWPLAAPVNTGFDLTQEAEAETARLLTQAIDHWSALGAASPEGLREGFLSRRGRLCDLPEAWKLTVDPRSIDVLLAGLPWGIGAVRLPWMDRPLMVDWS